MARASLGRTLAELGDLSGMNARAVSKAVHWKGARLPENKNLSTNLRKVLRELQDKL